MPGPPEKSQDPAIQCLCLHSIQVPWGLREMTASPTAISPRAQGTFLEPRSPAARFLPPASRPHPFACPPEDLTLRPQHVRPTAAAQPRLHRAGGQTQHRGEGRRGSGSHFWASRAGTSSTPSPHCAHPVSTAPGHRDTPYPCSSISAYPGSSALVYKGEPLALGPSKSFLLAVTLAGVGGDNWMSSSSLGTPSFVQGQGVSWG